MAHPVTHENARAVSTVGIGIGIGVAVAVAIGEHFDIDPDCDPDTDSDPEIWSKQSIFGTVPHAPMAHPVTHENARAVSTVGIGIGIGVAVAVAIGEHFDKIGRAHV